MRNKMSVIIPGSDESKKIMEKEAMIIVRDKRGSVTIPMQTSEVERLETRLSKG